MKEVDKNMFKMWDRVLRSWATLEARFLGRSSPRKRNCFIAQKSKQRQTRQNDLKFEKEHLDGKKNQTCVKWHEF